MTSLDQKRPSGWWLDACAIFVLASILIFPLFRLKYSDNWKSIESTFIADARILQESWARHVWQPLWQPLWYLGTRSNYVYPPGLRYGVAMVASALRCTPAKAYHILIALFYAFGIAGVYLWTRTASRSRGAAWLAAAGVALISPCFLLLPDVIADSPVHVPWRLHVLMTYGEGPHISSLAVLPIVWLGAWRRFHGGGVRWLLLSASAAAMVVTLNFYGATALAITFPLLAWACFLEQSEWRVLRDSLVIAALAYGLTAWWLTPSYLQVTRRNLGLVALPANAWSVWVFAAILIVYGVVSLAARSRVVPSAYSWFTWSVWGFFSLYILGHRWLGLQMAGNSERFLPEWDMFTILGGVLLAQRLWNWRPAGAFALAPRISLIVILIACFSPSWTYLEHANVEFRSDQNWQERVEYRTSEWLWENFPDQRVAPGGTIKFWYNVWHDGQQVEGGSQQGILNSLIPAAPYRIAYERGAQRLLHFLQMTGADIVVVPGLTSQEPYKEFENRALYDANFPLLRDDGHGNRYYRVPRRAPGIVRVVDRTRVLAAPPVILEAEAKQLSTYTDAIEAMPPGGGDAANRARGHWNGSGEFDVEAETRTGEALLFQETFDPYWRAYADGQRQTIKRDAAGLMMVDLPPGKHSIRMVFETPLEIIVGRALTIVTIVLGCWLLVVGYSRVRDAAE